MANENKVITALFYLTRACNIDCSYCRIWDNNFPDELSLADKIRAIDILWNEIGAGFIILFGGEPLMLGDYLEKIVHHCAQEGIEYAITSNSILLTREKAQRLVDAGLKNWSVSFDTLSGSTLSGDLPIVAKSNMGIGALHMLKKMGVPDLHATVTITRYNMHELIRMAEYCQTHGFWIEFTALHWGKNWDYYFASRGPEVEHLMLSLEDMNEIRPIMQTLKELKMKGYLIHNDPEYFDAFLEYAYALSWYCEGMSTLVVDADGQIKTCLHFNHIEGWDIFDLKSNVLRRGFLSFFSGSFPCRGCFWDCKWQSQMWREKDPEKGRRVFQHA